LSPIRVALLSLAYGGMKPSTDTLIA